MAAAAVAQPAAERPETAPLFRPLGLSRSTPTLAASYSLRQFAIDKKHIIADPRSPDRPASTGKIIALERIDLLGGNGGWRQKKAEVHFAIIDKEEREQRRRQKMLDDSKQERKEMREKKRRMQLEEEERKRREERERREAFENEKIRRRFEAEERKRLDREEEEREWLRRQPKTCKVCGGDTKCRKCSGSGFCFSMFLVPNVEKESLLTSGRIEEGCDECGGYRQNLLADLKMGSGLCPKCDGVGTITPKLEPWTPASRKRTAVVNFGDASPFGSDR